MNIQFGAQFNFKHHPLDLNCTFDPVSSGAVSNLANSFRKSRFEGGPGSSPVILVHTDDHFEQLKTEGWDVEKFTKQLHVLDETIAVVLTDNDAAEFTINREKCKQAGLEENLYNSTPFNPGAKPIYV